MTAYAGRPRPVPDLQTQPYWDGLRAERLLTQYCDTCSRHVHPAQPCCPTCLNVELRWVEVSGAGVIAGYCTMGQPFVGIRAPYDVVRVGLSDAPGVELIGNLVGRADSASAAPIEVGAPVGVVFEKVDDDLVLAQFALAGSGT